MKINELRDKFLKYFKSRGHEIVASSSLIPGNDPTLLFTNAGMVQFKDVFLGKEQRPYSRATSSQCCVRAGGKHNDLENVGYTARHHTFFEMLGNFSFGDYFKKEAIEFAWELLTKELGLPAEKLWVTVFKDDKEAEDIWFNHIKIDQKRFSRCGEKDNFWSMGDTGPCGPCTEIFYDHGDSIPGGPPGSPEEDGDRYIEIWNLVFMQYDRSADGTLTNLPKPSVDTGMGLERIAAVLQGVHNNYEIDLFRNLIKDILRITGVKDEDHTSIRVIADHIRSTSFLLLDGVVPSNEGRGYVLRRIIRRAIRHGYKLGVHEPFFHKIVSSLCGVMGEAYPKLIQSKDRIEKAILREEIQFAVTLESGMKIFEHAIEQLASNHIPGDVVFKLYDTYGFPIDLTADIARERKLTVDYAGFENAMAEQRERSQALSKFSVDYTNKLEIRGETEFTGYESTTDHGEVTALFNEQGEASEFLSEGEKGIVVLDRTPFYAESGGQIGDKGFIIFEGGKFEVLDTQKQALVYLHHGKMAQGQLKVGTKVNSEVDSARQAIMLNHTATHLVHAALRRILGEHVMQKGSLVEAARLRFDFAHDSALTPEEIYRVEDLVNQQIRANLSGHIDHLTPEEAMKRGALALFGEKYGAEVRMLSLGEFSKELCGGTHVSHTGEIGFFKIIGQSSVAAGIRRIEALTGKEALEWVVKNENLLHQLMDKIKAGPENLLDKVDQLLNNQRDLEKQIVKLKKQSSQMSTGNIEDQITKINNINVLSYQVDNLDAAALRELVDQLKQKFAPAVVLLASVEDSKVRVVGGVTKDLVGKIHAGELVSFVAEQIGGKGGGRPDMAQGGGENVTALDGALKSVLKFMEAKLGL